MRMSGLLCVILLGIASLAQAFEPSQGRLNAVRIAAGFETPWSLGVLPEGDVLLTEREGRLWRISPQGRKTAISGLPELRENGQGGLLDILIPRDFATSREVFLSFAKPQGRGEGTALVRARLEGSRLVQVQHLFEMRRGTSGGRHFGGRLAEGPQGHIFLTMGDRGDADQAQDLAWHNGKIIRLNRDGSVPADNPFVATPNAQPEIWSYGHRNPQGLGFDAAGRLWSNEHGARGGDEVNLIRKGANYGWPVISYGRHYSGARIGEGTTRPGMEQPQLYWDPSIAPSGMAILSGRMWPDWRGDILVGSLKFDYIARLSGRPLREVERLQGPETERLRDIREAPDGSLWFISEGQGALYRVVRGR